MTRGVLLVGLLISALLVVWLTLRSTKKPEAPSADVTGEPSSHLGEIPPEAITKDPKAAKKYIQGQSCSADCESKLQLCLAMADGQAAEGRCREQRTACERSCSASGEPTP